MSDVMLVASDLIIECVQNHDHELAIDYYRRIKEQEKKGDVLSTRIFNDLNGSFLTPFDKEDINKLSNRLDDVIDYINSCAKRIVLYNPKNLPESAIELARLVREDVICIGKALSELETLKKESNKVRDYCLELHEIENRADDVYENFLIELFEKEKNSIEIIKVKEIMYELEKAANASDYVGKSLKTILVKYA